MISFPIVGDGDRKQVRRFEVYHQVHAHGLRAAPGNVGIAAEVAVDLNGKGRYRDEKGPAGITGRVFKDWVHQQRRQPVGNDQLLEKPSAVSFRPQAVFS